MAPGGTVTLFETDVVNAPEVAGQELIGANDRETAVTTNDAGEEVTTVVGDGWIGPFIANPAGTAATGIGIDVIMPRGLYYANDDGSFSARTIEWEVEARAVDDEGEATGGWIAVASESVTEAENTPQRKSYRYTVAAGRYEVRVRRTNDKSGDARAGHEIRWVGLKTFLEDAPEFGAVTLLAVRMRATDNLSQRSARLVNVIVTRRLPVWDPETGWSEPQPTRSLAWAFADAARARYGAGLADARIDLAALHALDQVWQSRGDRFDAVFDQGLTVWEALTRIARCGRALPFLQGGILRIARDAPRTLPVALFGPRNIVKGSFRVQYVLPGEDTADAVTVTYFSERTWRPDEIVAVLPNSDADAAADKSATVELFGCTGAEQAMREGLYMAAANRYRRRIMTFRTELEGLIPTYGDLIAVTHDLPRWGQGGEVVDADGRMLTLSEPLEWQAGEEAADATGTDTAEPPVHYLALRKRDGSLSGPWPVSPGADDRSVVLSEDLEFGPYTGADEERTHFAFGPRHGASAPGCWPSGRAASRWRSPPSAKTTGSIRLTSLSESLPNKKEHPPRCSALRDGRLVAALCIGDPHVNESHLIEIERVRSEAAQHLAEHEIACERRYGELQAQLTKIEALHNPNTRLLYVVLGGMLAALGKTFWPVLGG